MYEVYFHMAYKGVESMSAHEDGKKYLFRKRANKALGKIIAKETTIRGPREGVRIKCRDRINRIQFGWAEDSRTFPYELKTCKENKDVFIWYDVRRSEP